MKIRYTIMEAKGHADYCLAGYAIEDFEACSEDRWVYTYRLNYISKGVVVSVLEDGKLKGYLG